MKYSIQNMEERLSYWDSNSKKLKVLNGYAFIGEHGVCIIIAWGENRRDLLIKYFNQYY